MSGDKNGSHPVKGKGAEEAPLDCRREAGEIELNLIGKSEGATGSLAIVVSDHDPSHPCGVTPRIAIAGDAPREATSRHVA